MTEEPSPMHPIHESIPMTPGGGTMRTFKLFRHPDGTDEIVKVGWSWPAFFLGCFWALWHKLWKQAILFGGIIIIVVLIGSIGGLTIKACLFESPPVQLLLIDSSPSQSVGLFGAIFMFGLTAIGWLVYAIASCYKEVSELNAPLEFGEELLMWLVHMFFRVTWALIWSCLACAWGLFGNRWRKKNLRSRGYECLVEVEAPNEDAAVAKLWKIMEERMKGPDAT